MQNYYTDYNMVKTFDAPENITIDQLALQPGDLSGDLISGGIVKNFSSTGIIDHATTSTLTVTDGVITVDTVNAKTLNGFSVRGDVKVYGTLDASEIRTTEMYVHRKYDQQYLEFANQEGEALGFGLLWTGGSISRQFILSTNPDRFFSTETIDLPHDKTYSIDTRPVLSKDTLGKSVINSNLQTVGVLRNLNVAGALNIADNVYFNPLSERFSIGTQDANGVLTVYDSLNDIELIMTGNPDGTGNIGTYNTKSLEIVTDNQVRTTFHATGDITLGVETKNTTIRVYGTVGIGVKNPQEQLEVAGQIKFANKLFAVGNCAPTAGNYLQGDIVWNTEPKANSFIGWVCVVGGNPGQWLPFGSIVPQ
jgi:hypothetical protein